MPFFAWNEDYSVKVKEIDNQHKKLIDIINQLYDAFKSSTTEEKMGDILDQLVAYADYHFKTEEKYFNLYGYEHSWEHKQQHNSFVEKVKKLQRDFNNRKATVTYQLMNFLRNWLIDHIQHEDQKYSDLLVGKGVK